MNWPLPHRPTEPHGAAADGRAGAAARLRRWWSAARSILLGAQSMSDEELAEAISRLRVGRVLAGPISIVQGAVLLVIHAVLTLFSNRRLLLLALVPAIWLTAVFWDWRFHVLSGATLPHVTGVWGGAVVVLILAATVASFWCNAAFALVAAGRSPGVGAALAASGGRRPLVIGSALALAIVHSWVALRGPVRGMPVFAVGMGIVALAELYLYTALPSQVVGLARVRRGTRAVVTRCVAVGALSLMVSIPGLVLGILGRLLLGVPLLKVLGILVLFIAVILQIAAATSGRAVSLTTYLDRRVT